MDPRCADALFFNGTVITMDECRPSARAIAVEDGLVVGVGSDLEVRRVAPRGCEKHDLGGKTVVPGFIDCHTHFVQMGVDAMSVDLSMTRSLEEALALLREAANRTPEGEWVVGTNWKESGWSEPVFINREALDSCSSRHPIVAHRVCGHMSAVNSLALLELGIGPETPGVESDASGRPTGILKERAVALARSATSPDERKRERALALAIRRAHSLGVTSIHDNGASEDFGLYRRAERTGKLGVRIWFNTPAENLAAMRKLFLDSGMGSQWLKLGGVKVFCDGALGARTAALSECYADDKQNRGMLVIDPEELDGLLAEACAAGAQVAVHAIGDVGIETALGSIRKGLKGSGRKDLRCRVEHLELPMPRHLRLMRELGVIASMQPNFVGEWGGPDGMYVSRLGPERAARSNPFKEVLSSRVRMVFGSDCMPFSPLYGIHSAVNAPYSSQRITVKQALAAYTREAAFASFEERSKGVLSEGRLADFVVLSENPFEVPRRISSIVVLKTVLSGRPVYERGIRRGKN